MNQSSLVQMSTDLMSGLFAAFADAKPLQVISASLSEEQQAQEAWLKERWGKFTSSEIHRLMAVKGLGEGAKTYIREKAAECMTPFVFDEFSTPAMEWGKEHELEAIVQFEQATGIRVNNTGKHQQFILSECGQWGGTPDGVIFDSGVEVKCPKSANHLQYLDVNDAASLKEIESKYYWQIQSYMALTGKDFWYFISYDPRFFNIPTRLHYCVIERVQSDIDLMLERIALAVIERDKIIKRLSN